MNCFSIELKSHFFNIISMELENFDFINHNNSSLYGIYDINTSKIWFNFNSLNFEIHKFEFNTQLFYEKFIAKLNSSININSIKISKSNFHFIDKNIIYEVNSQFKLISLNNLNFLLFNSEIIPNNSLNWEKELNHINFNNVDKLILYEINSSNQGIFKLDIKSGNILVNNAYALMLGYSPGCFVESYSSWYERIHPNDRFRSKRIFDDIIEGKINEYKNEFRQRKSNGDWIWLSSFGKIVEYDSFQKPCKIIGICNNINEKKQIDENLQIASQKFKDLINSIPTGIYIYQFYEPDKLILIEANPATERLTGKKIKDIIGLEFNQIWENANKFEITQKYLNVVRTGKYLELEDLYYEEDNLKGYYRIIVFLMPDKKLCVAFNNLTNLKNNELALIESEERYKMIIENQNDYILKLDSNYNIIFSSSSFCKLKGKSDVEILKHKFTDFIDPEDLNKFIQKSQDLYIQPYSCYFEHKSMTVFGWRWLGWSNRAVYDKNGSIQSIIAVGRDITASKLDEERINEKNKHLQFLADTAFELSGLIDMDSTQDFIIKKIGEFTGASFVLFSDYSEKDKVLTTNKIIGNEFIIDKFLEIVGKKVTTFKTTLPDNQYNLFISNTLLQFSSFSEVSYGQIPEIIDKSLKLISGIDRIYGLAFALSGHLYGIALCGLNKKSKTPDNEVLISFANICSLSFKRISAENYIKVLSRGIEQSPVFVVITNRDAEIEYINPQMTHVTGYSSEELIGKNPRILKSGKISESVYKDMWEKISSGKVWTGEFLNKKKNGELFWEQAIISPIIDNKGNITNYIAVKQDITSIKRLNEDLLIAKQKAEENDKLKTAFLQNMSHEIRTPLNGIMGFSQLLSLEGISSEERIEYSKTIQSSSRRLIEIINNIMEISKIETGQTELNIAPTKISNTITDVFNFFHISKLTKSIELRLNLSGECKDLLIKTDEQKVYQILNNLLSNALKFTLSGYIELGCTLIKDKVQIYVKDTGVGVPPHQQISIFERFYQGDTKLSRNYEGAGIGLSICKGYINLLGGDIWVESTQGLGSTFYFTLPYINN